MPGPAESRTRADLWWALASLVEAPDAARTPVAQALELGGLPAPEEHTDLFVLQLPPYGSIYLGPEGMLGGEARARVAGFWRAVGRTPPPEPDHLGYLLALYASLLADGVAGAGEPGSRAPEEAEEISAGAPPPGAPGPSSRPPGGPRKRLAEHARAALFREHLSPWLLPYLVKVEEVGGSFYRGWSRLLREALRDEADLLGPGGELPVHLREAPSLDEETPRTGPAGADAGSSGRSGRRNAEEASGDLAGRLLVPVRSGLILTRSDLLRGARRRGLPLRIGERRFMLRAMLAADRRSTIEWLLEEAEAWVDRHRSWKRVNPRAGEFWERRVRRTVRLLGALTRT